MVLKITDSTVSTTIKTIQQFKSSKASFISSAAHFDFSTHCLSDLQFGATRTLSDLASAVTS